MVTLTGTPATLYIAWLGPQDSVVRHGASSSRASLLLLLQM